MNNNGKYDFKSVEKKWQEIWMKNKAFAATDDFSKKKFYCLVEFPYPSGQGLHVGHPRSYTALDIIARKRRLQGYNVLYPMGWDAFGLPTENFAIKNKIHPKIVTKNNVEKFKKQLCALGLSFDWDREVNTTDPSYYKWTQWIFIKLYEHGLAYKKEASVNWCESCKCVLANEEVINGKCERCAGDVSKRVKSQWMLKITEYAQRLIDDLDTVDYPEKVKTQQKNWIGRSEGAQINFGTTLGDDIEIFTTRPDTIFGVTYMVISPEHRLIAKWRDKIKNFDAVDEYIKTAQKKSDIERTDFSKPKSGIQVQGVYAIHPFTNAKIPVFVSDYVLASYGTGAIMAVPAHDTRDWDFAKKYNIEIKQIIDGRDAQNCAYTDCDKGVLINSEFLDGLSVKEAKKRVIYEIQTRKIGSSKINYKLRDWVFSRQRYWGEPIPIVFCEKCGYVPIPESELPLELPDVEYYEPTDDGESPLSRMTDWVNVTCPKCRGKAKRETDTMPQWAGSSWYFLRYIDPHNKDVIADKKLLDYWMPVDWYNGGMEHTTLHLLYSRFWHKFLYDIGVVRDKEPYRKRTSHGMILGSNGDKMSKSRGNVINPDDIVTQYGADVLRLYEMFMGDFEKAAPWSQESIKGCKRFLERFWALKDILLPDDVIRPAMDALLNKMIKKVSEDIERLGFNTAIAVMMSFMNEIYEIGSITKKELRLFTLILNPFAPHITEEMWQSENLGEGMLFQQSWPEFDPEKCKDKEVEIAVQLNGKVRFKINVTPDSTQEQVFNMLSKNENYFKYTQGKQVLKKIYVKNRLVNIITD